MSLRTWLSRLERRRSNPYDYRAVVAEISKSLAGVVDAREMASLLGERLSELLRLEGALVFLKNADGDLVPIENDGKLIANEILLPPQGAVASELLRHARPLEASELEEKLTGATLSLDEERLVANKKIGLVAPLVRTGETRGYILARLQGLLLLGIKHDGVSFDPEDRRLVATLAWGAATAAENVELVRALEGRAEEVNRLYSELVETRERERKRVSRELHDDVIQDLVDLVYSSPGPSEPRLRQIIDKLRRLCAELRPSALDDLSLSLALEGHLEDLRRNYGLPVSLRLPDGEPGGLDELTEEAQLCLFRVFTEALTNVRRHAAASEVEVELTARDGKAILRIRDNGRGFDCPKNLGSLVREGRFGLAGAREQIQSVGGELRVTSRPGHGTTVAVEVPIESRGNQGKESLVSTQP